MVDLIDNLLMTNRKTQRAKGVGILTNALAQTVERENPDFLFVIGDREESIATALVGNYMDVLVAHLGGGIQFLEMPTIRYALPFRSFRTSTLLCLGNTLTT